MFDQENYLLPGAHVIVALKIISLFVYAILIVRLYKSISKTNSKCNNKYKILWKRNIVAIYISYIIAYVIYAAIITGIINFNPLIHLQILVMVGLVFYVAYIAFVQPEIFKGEIALVDPKTIFKI